jgi:CO/xanthine dehydrogenase Mo-binding subunit
MAGIDLDVNGRSYTVNVEPNTPLLYVLRNDLELNGPTACGAGEAASCPVGAAIGNAIFDATGARLRHVPFTPGRLLADLQAPSADRLANT